MPASAGRAFQIQAFQMQAFQIHGPLATSRPQPASSEQTRTAGKASERWLEELRAHQGLRRALPLRPGELITLSTRNADLVEILRAFARLADLDLVLQPGIRGSVTVELRNVPWEQALGVLLRTHGLAAQVDGRVWAVRSAGNAALLE